MLTQDTAASQVQSAVAEAKRSVTLATDNQKDDSAGSGGDSDD
jgi:hypothetical protein